MLERLQKIIAHAGIASRRHAEQLILSGQVLVNGQVVRELGSKADPTIDKIEAAGRLVEEKRKSVYLILHKPPEVVSSLADPEGRKTLRNFLRGFPERVYPVGNLDYAASGLIFLTNDGDLTDKMLKSWSNIPQVYHIKIKGKLMLEELDHLGRQTKTIVRVVRQPDSTRGHAANFWYEAQVTGSKLDVLGRTLQKSGHPLEKVKRIGLGPFSLEGVPVGHYVLLSNEQAEAMRNPTRPLTFVPHFKPKPTAKPAHRPVSPEQSYRHSNVPGKAQRFSTPPFSKSDKRPARYTKFQRRPSTPPNVREDFDEIDDERLDSVDAPRAPWLNASPRPSANPSATSRPGRNTGPTSKSQRTKGPRGFVPSHGPDRPSHISGKFRRPSHGPGKSPRHPSARSKSNRNFPPRKPRSPR
jgi:23S rRNA pseudouridine2605 synthase